LAAPKNLEGCYEDIFNAGISFQAKAEHPTK
jgi:hypothetical protein